MSAAGTSRVCPSGTAPAPIACRANRGDGGADRSSPASKAPPGVSSPKGIVVKFKSILGSCVALLAVAGAAVADETTPFTINGELRVRNENDNRDFNSEHRHEELQCHAHAHRHQRAPGERHERVHAGAGLPRARARPARWSRDPSVQEDGKLDLHQGYFQVDNLGWQGFGIQAGRMEVRFGNERLIGVDDWSNVTRSFDGVMANVSHGRVNAADPVREAGRGRRHRSSARPSNQNKGDATMQAAYGMIAVTEKAERGSVRDQRPRQAVGPTRGRRHARRLRSARACTARRRRCGTTASRARGRRVARRPARRPRTTSAPTCSAPKSA